MIMLVDDDIEMRELCSLFLEAEGYDVSTASCAEDALDRMRTSSHELVISDCAMPGMSGLELSRNLRSDPSTAGVPILLMSGSLRRDVGNGPSYDAFLRKPFLAEHLLVEVRKLLAPAAGTPIIISTV